MEYTACTFIYLILHLVAFFSHCRSTFAGLLRMLRFRIEKFGSWSFALSPVPVRLFVELAHGTMKYLVPRYVFYSIMQIDSDHITCTRYISGMYKQHGHNTIKCAGCRWVQRTNSWCEKRSHMVTCNHM